MRESPRETPMDETTPETDPRTDAHDDDEIRRYFAENGIPLGPEGSAGPRKSGPPLRWDLIGAAALVVALVGWFVLHGTQDASESIHRIRHYPAQFKDKSVQLRGRVGQVFPLGGSYAYYLHQHRDTIVVFTRGARPQEQRDVYVRGSVSIGYLDGAARPALFERERR